MPISKQEKSIPFGRRGLAILALWPGLAQIWTGQEWLGLILSLFFALNVNAALLTHFVWREALSASAAAFFLVAGCATWLLAACYTAWWALRCDPERHRAEIERLYRESLSCYLKGEWRGARLLCEQVLARDETDAEALFHLGLVHVRLNQFELARRAFRQCLESAGGTTWRWEIERELERIKHLTIPSN